MLFKVAFCFLAKKAKALTNNSIHKTLKAIFMFMSHHNQKAKSTF